MKIGILDSDGNSAGLIALFTDITQQKDAEKQRIILEKVIDGVKTNIFVVRKTEKKNLPLELLFVNESTLNLLNWSKADIPSLTTFWSKTIPNHHNRLLEKISNAKTFPIEYRYPGAA